MTRLLSCAALLLAIVEILPAAPVPATPTDPTKDREGNPLPKGAKARLGSLTYRGPTTSGLTFSKDGKRLYATERDRVVRWDPDSGEKKPDPRNNRLLVWEADSGKLLVARPFDPAIPANSYASSCVAGDRIITLIYDIDLTNRKMNEESTGKGGFGVGIGWEGNRALWSSRPGRDRGASLSSAETTASGPLSLQPRFHPTGGTWLPSL